MTSDPGNLRSYSFDGGNDKIFVDDDTGLRISHASHTVRPLKSSEIHNVLAVPEIK